MKWLLWAAFQVAVVAFFVHIATEEGSTYTGPLGTAVLAGVCISALLTGLLTAFSDRLRYWFMGGPKPVRYDPPVPYPRSLAKSVQEKELLRASRSLDTLPRGIESEEGGR